MLYLISGSPSPKSAATYPSTLYAFDRAAVVLRSLRTLAPATDGTEFINAWPDYRFAVVASPHVRPTHFEVISMDSPLTARAFDIDPGPMSFISATLLDIPRRDLYEAIYLAHGKATRVIGAGLLQSGTSLATETLGSEDLRYARFGGLYGGAQGGRDASGARLRGGKLESWVAGTWSEIAAAPSGLRLPAGEEVSVPVANKDFIAVVQPSAGDGSALAISVFSRFTKQWSTLPLPGSRAWIRAFGPWLVAAAAEPLNGRRNPGYGLRRHAATANGPAVEAQFEESGLFFPGKLVIYDSRVSRSVLLETGQADSEVLLVDNISVIYRVNNALLEARFNDRCGLDKPVRLLEDELLADVHWAFSGPAPR